MEGGISVAGVLEVGVGSGNSSTAVSIMGPVCPDPRGLMSLALVD